METNSEEMRDRLLSRLPKPENLAAYRSEVNAGIEKNDKSLNREKKFANGMWAFNLLLGIVLFLGSGLRMDSSNAAHAANAAYIGTYACFFLIGGIAQLLKYFINRNRVDMLKEVKQLQLQVLELQASIDARLPANPGNSPT